MRRSWFPALAGLLLTGLLLIGSCATAPTASKPAAQPIALGPAAPPPPPAQASGRLAVETTTPRPSASYGAPLPALAGAPPAPPATGDSSGNISLNFAATDIRTVVDQIVGGILHANYTIDPGVSGQVTFRTVTPLPRDAMIPTLRTLLAQDNAVLVRPNGLYRIMSASQPAAPILGGATVLPLRYANAGRLAATLQPYAGRGATITAEPGGNALLIAGDPATRAGLAALARLFDVDALARQSYALFPVPQGDTKDFAAAFAAALAEPGAVTVVPLEPMSAVLVIARVPSDLGNAARVYAVLDQGETLRGWRVFTLRYSRANDAAYVLQQAFTPDNVTALPTPANGSAGSGSTSTAASSASTGAGGLLGAAVISGGSTGQNAGASQGSIDNASQGSTNYASQGSTNDASQGSTGGASASLGSLSPTPASSGPEIQIIPDLQHDALLVDATPREDAQIEAMLAKIDIMPLQVRIDATIAEVDLTGALQYGTQFFFKSGDINVVLSNGTTSSLATNFPGFVLSGSGGDAAPLAISALQAVTKVRVLSKPELTVQDGQTASLLGGQLVPYLTQTSQNTTGLGAPVINSVAYRETGVILNVTPHIGNDGMVTLDVAQEVSGVAPDITTAGIDSPTFTERAVTSRVAIGDGQTIGLAGIITDDDSHDNQGIPFLKNIPVLGALFGSQNNKRTRQELLVLITPHVIGNQQQALELTADLDEQFPSAMRVPGLLQAEALAGSADPDAALRARLTQ